MANAFSADISRACLSANIKEIIVHKEVMAKTGIEIMLISPRIFKTPGEYAIPSDLAS